MPTNLNALIRYKQIDLCLRNPYLKATIQVMQEKCSDQLAEHRGVYKLVSERTIRDDIRVMRSDALGFNAPIVVHNGIYSYNEKNYSIFNISFSKIELLEEVTKLLLEEKENIQNKEKFEQLLKELSNVTGIKLPDTKQDSVTYIQEFNLYSETQGIASKSERTIRNYKKIFEKPEVFSWERIFEIL